MMTGHPRSRSRLFQRPPDECFVTLASLATRCAQERSASRHILQRPSRLTVTSDLKLVVDDETALFLMDWAFGQLCRLAKVNKETMNRLTRRMASQILQRMWPTPRGPGRSSLPATRCAIFAPSPTRGSGTARY